MSPPEIVLLGYYGRGNFGDDVLMVVTHELAREMLPGARVALRIGTDATYPERLLGSGIERLPFGTRERHRLVLHGGGGTFFDFQPHGLLHRGANAMLLASGAKTFVRLEAALRRLNGRPRLSARTRLGLGLGIGTFSRGSPRLREALSVLADFDALWVRDEESAINLSRLGVTPHVVRGSDLAFLWDHWCPPELVHSPPRARTARPRVGVILRDWPVGSGEDFARRIRSVLDRLAGRFDLTLFSLDPATDAGTLSALSSLPQIIWAPDRMDIAAFAEQIAQQDVLLTARAHGAICGACLGRASVILGIEPKLKAVHAMLPRATRLVSPPYEPETIAAALDEVLAVPADEICSDAVDNRNESERALVALMERIDL